MSEIDNGLLNGTNLVGGLIAQGHKASDYIDGMFDAHAKKAAGQAIAAGDNTTAASLLGSRGFLDEAQALKDRANASSTLSSLNTKDFASAKTTAAASGDPALYSAASTAEASDKSARVAWMAHAADALLQIKDPAQRHDAYQQAIMPTLKAMGVPDDQLASIGQQSLTDEGLASFKASLGQMSKMQTHVDAQTGEIVGIDEAGGVRVLRPGHDRKPEWKERKKADGSTELVDVNKLSESAGQTAPAGGFDSIYHGFVAPHEGGYTASDGNGAPANFGINQAANPEVDVKSLTPAKAKALLHDKYWGPSGAESLPPALQAVQFDTAVNMGVGAAKNLLAKSGGDPEKYLELRADRYRAIAAADPSKASKLPVWLARNDDLKHYIAGASTAAGSPGAVPWDAAKPPKPEESTEVNPTIVKGLIEGRLAPPTQKAAATPYWQAQLEAATAQDPTFDGVNFQARQKARNDFTSGKSANDIKALNTMVGHLDTLNSAIDGLGNYGLKLNNVAAHFIANQTGTDARIKTFETAKEAVANELTRVFRGTGGAEADIKAWKAQLDSSGSPTALKATVRQMAELINSRMEAVGEQYRQGMGVAKDPIQLLTPDKQAAFSRLSGKTMEAGGAQKVRRYNPATGKLE